MSPEGYEKGCVLCKHKYTVTSKPTFDTMAIKKHTATIQYACRISEKNDFQFGARFQRIPMNVHALTKQLDEVFFVLCVDMA